MIHVRVAGATRRWTGYPEADLVLAPEDYPFAGMAVKSNRAGERRYPMKRSPKKGRSVIFRRYRRVPGTNTVLDAYDYGLKAWPIHLM